MKRRTMREMMKVLALSALLLACHSSSATPADAGASIDAALVTVDAHAPCVRVAIIRGADVCLPPAERGPRTSSTCVSLAQLERQLRSTHVANCAPDGKRMGATMDISAKGTLVSAAADRLDTGILAACLMGALGSTVWPSNRDDYSITIDIDFDGDCSVPQLAPPPAGGL